MSEPAGDAPVLVINSGSSSVKYQLLRPRAGTVLAKGLMQRIGEDQSSFTHSGDRGFWTGSRRIVDHAEAFRLIEQAFAEAGPRLADEGVGAVGHRVVHGGPRFCDPVVLDDASISAIADLSPLAPLHNPAAVAGIRAARTMLPGVPHVAVFDTAFFASLPAAASTYAIPRDLAEQYAIRRYGFHGTSHRYVSEVTAQVLDRELGDLNQIVLHLGNGCSASAIRGGAAVDTSMGLTPLQGLVMGTRSGDVDPGLHGYLNRELGWSAERIDRFLNSECGLKGLGGVNDFRELERRRTDGDEAAQLAFDVYVHRIRHYLGAYLVTLGRLDALTFTAGVGEHSAALRAAVLDGLAGLGFELNAEANKSPSTESRLISTPQSRVAVLVVPTNEELAIARNAAAAAESAP